jgi:hypothetical protein
MKTEMRLQGVTMEALIDATDYKSTGTISSIIDLKGSPNGVITICEELGINARAYLNDGYDV